MSKNNLSKLAEEMRREYMRNWRSANKEKVKLHSENYWKRKAKESLLKGGEDSEHRPNQDN